LAHGVIGGEGGKIEGGGPVWTQKGPELDNPLFYQNGSHSADLTHITTNYMPFSLSPEQKQTAPALVLWLAFVRLLPAA
jgi:hypothetical protein